MSAVTADQILAAAGADIAQRGPLRDQPTGERSMSRAIAAFNALHGTCLTEVQGWQFMELLKHARATGGKHHPDDHQDRAAYAALAGEAAAREAAR
ncbi:DUF6378 domain-containing protein [Stenotrophomonas sp. PS02298]|uniref:DUF6378 domain-containing protein n=1 Tax=Stenotrophomonas sp. PS02298 TaxID=2991424 RepID=UPI00249A26BA|nr:DUF6378 domain-containing protein [Stenotrophomonas sp. PS02298]